MVDDTPSLSAPLERLVPESLVGRILDRKYRLDRLLAARVASAVFAGTHLDLSMPVAVKLLFGPFPPKHLRTELFFQAGRIGATVQHPGLVRVFDIGVTADELRYVVMDLVEGETLAARLKDYGPLPVPEAISIASDIASAIDAVHAKGFLHRDLQPSNVLLAHGAQGATSGAVRVLGFGLAKPIRVQIDERDRDTLRELTRNPKELPTIPSVLYGSPAYLSPEQLLGRSLGPPSDVYALGVVLYEMLTGAPVFGDPESPIEAIGRHLGTRPQPPSSRAPDAGIRPELDSVVLRALAKDPAARYETAAELRSALLEVSEARSRGNPVLAPDDQQAVQSIPMVASTKARWLVVSAVVGVAILALFLAVGSTRDRRLPSQVTSSPSVSVSPSLRVQSAAPAPPEVVTTADLPVVPASSVTARSRPPAVPPRMPPPRSTGVTTRPASLPPPVASTAPTAPPSTTSGGYKIDDLKTPFD